MSLTILKNTANEVEWHTDVMGFPVIVPSDDLNNIRLDSVDRLFPAVFPESIAELYPVIGAPEFLKLSR